METLLKLKRKNTNTLRQLSLPREDTVSVVKSYTYDDGCEPCGTDTFIREPFVVAFSSRYTGRLWNRDLDELSKAPMSHFILRTTKNVTVFATIGDLLASLKAGSSLLKYQPVPPPSCISPMVHSCQELCPDPSAHLTRFCCGGSGCPL